MNLFVYGTLAPGEPNEHLLKGVNGVWIKATVKGRLHPYGWGSDLGFPGIVLSSEGQDITGLVFSSAELNQHLKRLDEFEGEGYQRVLTSAILENGESVNTYIYELSEARGKIK